MSSLYDNYRSIWAEINGKVTPENRRNWVMNNPDATETQRARAEFDYWYETQVLPVYDRFVALEKSFEQLKEVVDVLNGSLNVKSRPKSAIRYQDFRFMKDLPSLPTARKASGSVSVEDYNRLVDDMHKLYAALGSIGMIIGRMNP